MPELDEIKRLRALTHASMIECKHALEEAGGNFEKAMEILKRKGFAKAAKKAERAVGPGIVEAYIHPGGQVGAMIEVRCETDFVARNAEFKKLAHELCLQVASMAPLWISPEDIPEDLLENEKRRMQEELTGLGKSGAVLAQALQGKLEDYYKEVCLLKQPHIKNQDETVSDLISHAIAKLGENIKVSNFCRLDI